MDIGLVISEPTLGHETLKEISLNSPRKDRVFNGLSWIISVLLNEPKKIIKVSVLFVYPDYIRGELNETLPYHRYHRQLSCHRCGASCDS